MRSTAHHSDIQLGHDEQCMGGHGSSVDRFDDHSDEFEKLGGFEWILYNGCEWT
jgi:hypothetical protein